MGEREEWRAQAGVEAAAPGHPAAPGARTERGGAAPERGERASPGAQGEHPGRSRARGRRRAGRPKLAAQGAKEEAP